MSWEQPPSFCFVTSLFLTTQTSRDTYLDAHGSRSASGRPSPPPAVAPPRQLPAAADADDHFRPPRRVPEAPPIPRWRLHHPFLGGGVDGRGGDGGGSGCGAAAGRRPRASTLAPPYPLHSGAPATGAHRDGFRQTRRPPSPSHRRPHPPQQAAASPLSRRQRWRRRRRRRRRGRWLGCGGGRQAARRRSGARHRPPRWCPRGRRPPRRLRPSMSAAANL